MKKYMLVLVAVMLAWGSIAQALYIPPSNAPLYIKFDNKEQISASESIVAPSGALEANWGVLKISTIALGNVSVDPQNFNPVSPPLWTDSAAAEITGIFYGVQASSVVGSVFNSKNGYIDLYYDDTPDADLAAATLAQRVWDNSFTNFTDGTFLVRISFMNGAVTVLDPAAGITGSTVPVSGGFAGFANSYGAVDMSAPGAWSTLLNGNYFNTLLGLQTADLKFRNVYENTGSHDWDVPGTDIFGAQSSDPARAYTVPEPSTFLLFGLGLLGAGVMARRRKVS